MRNRQLFFFFFFFTCGEIGRNGESYAYQLCWMTGCEKGKHDVSIWDVRQDLEKTDPAERNWKILTCLIPFTFGQIKIFPKIIYVDDLINGNIWDPKAQKIMVNSWNPGSIQACSIFSFSLKRKRKDIKSSLFWN